MTNHEIILKAALAAGIYTKEEAAEILSHSLCLPLHTFAEWRRMGYAVNRGAHAVLVCSLWQYTDKPGKVTKAARVAAAQAGQQGPAEDAPDPHYYMQTAHLFAPSQVHRLDDTTRPKIKTPAEIAAYNAQLAAARKAKAQEVSV